jgi:hypothetical protein
VPAVITSTSRNLGAFHQVVFEKVTFIASHLVMKIQAILFSSLGFISVFFEHNFLLNSFTKEVPHLPSLYLYLVSISSEIQQNLNGKQSIYDRCKGSTSPKMSSKSL